MADEKRLIDANALVEKLTYSTLNGWGKDVPYISSQWAIGVKIKDNFLQAIAEVQTVDAVEVVHGQWEKASETMPIYRCSICKERNLFKNGSNILSNYCPNCGAKMDGDGNG